MSLPIPTPAQRKKMAALVALSEQGTAGETAACLIKIANLRKIADFNAEKPLDEKDLFADIPPTKFDPTARPLIDLPLADCDLAPLIQWTLLNGLQVESTIRQDAAWNIRVFAHIGETARPRLVALAGHVAGAFASAWRKAIASGAFHVTDRRLFFRGIYDGMMNDQRKSGESIQTPPDLKRTPRASRRTLSTSTACVHPYTLGTELGKRIRLSAPTTEIENLIETHLTPALANA